MLRESYTAIVERSEALRGSFATEPYECGWAGEAIFFVRILEHAGNLEGVTLQVQISPDGIRWCDEGTSVTLGEEENCLLQGGAFWQLAAPFRYAAGWRRREDDYRAQSQGIAAFELQLISNSMRG